jgi:hypothetical protein
VHLKGYMERKGHKGIAAYEYVFRRASLLDWSVSRNGGDADRLILVSGHEASGVQDLVHQVKMKPYQNLNGVSQQQRGRPNYSFGTECESAGGKPVNGHQPEL